MRQRRLGRTNLQVSEVGFGAWAIGGNKHGHSYGPTDNAESLRAMGRPAEKPAWASPPDITAGWGGAGSGRRALGC